MEEHGGEEVRHLAGGNDGGACGCGVWGVREEMDFAILAENRHPTEGYLHGKEERAKEEEFRDGGGRSVALYWRVVVNIGLAIFYRIMLDNISRRKI